MEHSYFDLMLYSFQEDCKQPEGYKVGLLNIHMIQDKTIQQIISHSFTHNSHTNYIFNSNLKYLWKYIAIFNEFIYTLKYNYVIINR